MNNESINRPKFSFFKQLICFHIWDTDTVQAKNQLLLELGILQKPLTRICTKCEKFQSAEIIFLGVNPPKTHVEWRTILIQNK